ncbi:MAG: UDP-N-acetylmuramate dehydrogenase [Planctomycetota bacterium]
MNWFKNAEKEMNGAIVEKAPLAPLTTMGVGGPARYLARPQTNVDAIRIRKIADSEGLDITILGGGSNIIVSDAGIKGIVIKLDSDLFRSVETDGSDVTWRVGAGARLSRLVAAAAESGLSGLEPVAGIPGTVGAALRMNAGGKFGTIGSVVDWVEVITDGETRRLSQSDAGFGYRSSKLGDVLVVRCGLKLAASDPATVRARTKEVIDYKALSQPLSARSAGCIFKNPENDSAGRLIEAAGMKGARCGGASVSDQHANFIVNDGTASASDVMTLIRFAHRSVMNQFGINLELEVKPCGQWKIAA